MGSAGLLWSVVVKSINLELQIELYDSINDASPWRKVSSSSSYLQPRFLVFLLFQISTWKKHSTIVSNAKWPAIPGPVRFLHFDRCFHCPFNQVQLKFQSACLHQKHFWNLTWIPRHFKVWKCRLMVLDMMFVFSSSKSTETDFISWPELFSVVRISCTKAGQHGASAQ